MRGISYKINKPGSDPRSGESAVWSGAAPGKSWNKADSGERQYAQDELEGMTTHQLRTICHQERLVRGVVEAQDREELIRTIMKYRGSEDGLFIRKHRKGGMERIEAALRSYLNTPMRDAGEIQIPAKMTLYSGLRLDKRDGYRVRVGSVNAVGESNVLIVNERNELCGIMSLLKVSSEPGTYMLHADKDIEFRRTSNRNYSMLFFRKQDSEYLFKTYYSENQLPPTNLHYWRLPVAELDIRELEETQAVLAIDFGTSNTTAGSYLDYGYINTPNSHDMLNGKLKLGTINYVAFAAPEAEQAGDGWIEMLPTAISVADCSNPEDITYVYGYEALHMMRKNGYSSRASTFLGLKRWVNGSSRLEEVTDEQGNTAEVLRSDIIRAYLLHIIETAEHQFKCRFKQLHFTSPVKLKEQFLTMFNEVLSDYTIEMDHAIDEGMAVLYNTIADQIEQNRYMDGETYDALVIDCGGGTTDLSSCRFRIEEGRISYNIDIHTAYENGDTNFGGNNLTYRVMQYMKLVFANYYRRGQSEIDIDELIGAPGVDLFRHVDEYGVGSVYETLEQRYQEAEQVLPTSFRHYENRTRDEYGRVRHNFYFLWELAEALKVEFFRRTGITRRRFDSDKNAGAGHAGRYDNDLHVTSVDRWSLSVLEDGRFTTRYDCPSVVFTVNEMTKLLKADIYSIVSKFLDDFYQDGRLQQYRIIKLTGQSCRIDVFREALKEFVPGRSIEFRQKADEPGKVPDLKLACLRGAIRYLTARKIGQIDATVTRSAPVVPYTVTAYTHQGREMVLVNSMERLSRMRGAVSRPIGVTEVEFYLKGSDERLRRKYIYANDPGLYKSALYEEIAALYGDQIPQEETDSIVNGETKFFVVTGENQWGFHIVPVARLNEQLQLGEKRLFTFEDDLSELDFFDGMK